ncbi:hypothetical protein [Methyloceanibacter marginalis]|nr:hypothetical protein [Methyloceanibacter marginalis]
MTQPVAALIALGRVDKRDDPVAGFDAVFKNGTRAAYCSSA